MYGLGGMRGLGGWVGTSGLGGLDGLDEAGGLNVVCGLISVFKFYSARVDKHFTDKCRSVDIKTASKKGTSNRAPAT